MRVIPQPRVVSVWHSGTRTLVKHLGFDTHQHFLHYDAELKANYGDGNLVHIPIRHPMIVAESWARRGKPLDALLRQYESMFAYLERCGQPGPMLYKMEDLPRLAGTDDRDVDREGRPAAIAIYQREVAEKVVREHESFFCQFYPDPYHCPQSSLAEDVWFMNDVLGGTT